MYWRLTGKIDPPSIHISVPFPMLPSSMTDANDAQAQATANPNKTDDESYSTDDLIALIRAVKFAHPDISRRAVLKEITGVIAESDPSYSFLKDVQLNDVKKVWKKSLKGPDSSDNESKKNDAPAAKDKEDVLPPTTDGILKFYTVGDGSVKTLAENYANHYARAAAEAESNNTTAEDDTKYTHFFLDVPADRSGSRPHQALINFNDNKKGKQKQKKNSIQDKDGRELFKIQIAAAPPGMEDMHLPMLLYNSDRSAKSFLHPPSEETEDDGGYFKIKNMIKNSGTSGALGQSGGSKAYFWGVVRELKADGRKVVSLDTIELAPTQVW